MRVELTYKDVQEIVKKYQLVLKRPRKRAMRGQRNFTGKIEDEIRGKLGEIGIAITDLDPDGQVQVHGEIWKASSKNPINKGKKVKIDVVRNLTVWVSGYPDE